MAKCCAFGLIALSLVPAVAAAKGNKVSHQDIAITKKLDKASPMITPAAPRPIPIPYPNSGGSKSKK